jgi:transcriptional pleiotropic regulator of transition state genes
MRKATGIVRKVDDLGRIVIPKETRRTLDIHLRDAVEIFVDGDEVILRKYEPGCVFCGGLYDLRELEGKHICRECVDVLSGAWL